MSQNGPNADKKSVPREHPIAIAVIGAVAVLGAALITVLLSRGGGSGPSTTTSLGTSSPAITNSSHSSVSPTESSVPVGAQASGSITYPSPGAANVPSPKTLTAAGTVQHLEPGHHLLVFLQFGTQQVYWGGDTDVVVGSSGHWSGTICVGDPGGITLWLVDLGPEGLTALVNPAKNYSGKGVPFIPTKLASDVSILDSISVTAVRTSTACTKQEPQYYG
jgi:hypothetical protein